MKRVSLFFGILLFAAAYGQKLYFTACSEIDLVKKGNEAYFKSYWQTLRSFYVDIAKILFNSWFGEEMGTYAYIEMLKSGVADLAEYKMSDDVIYEMVINENGEHWVHTWLLWSAKHNNGKEFSSPVHLVTRGEEGKVIFQGVISNQLTGYLATMSSDTVKTQ